MENKEIIEKINQSQVDFVGISPCYLNMENALNLVKEIKASFQDILICLGGHHATFCCDDILKNERNIDFIVRGEGENTIVDLMNAIVLGSRVESNYNLASIPGLSFRSGDMVYHNPDRAVEENLDNLPFPIRDPLNAVVDKGGYAMPLICTSRGCPSNCSFCSTPNFWGRKWRPRSPKNVVDEIEDIIMRYGLTHFYVTDDQIAGHGESGRKHIDGIIRELVRRGLNKRYDLHFFVMFRADFFTTENEDIISQFPEVGFMDIFIGFESSDQSQLGLYTKGVSQDKYKTALQLLKKYSIFVEGGFIIFNPYSTFASLRKDALFIRNLGVPLFGYYVKELMPIPGTQLYQSLVAEELLVNPGYKKTTLKYKSKAIEQFKECVTEVFKDIEATENIIFMSLDMKIKLEGVIDRISDKNDRHQAIMYIMKASQTYGELCTLYFNTFETLLSSYENEFNSNLCSEIIITFKESFFLVVTPLICDYKYISQFDILKKTRRCLQ